jgi:hypothetical protein
MRVSQRRVRTMSAKQTTRGAFQVGIFQSLSRGLTTHKILCFFTDETLADLMPARLFGKAWLEPYI